MVPNWIQATTRLFGKDTPKPEASDDAPLATLNKTGGAGNDILGSITVNRGPRENSQATEENIANLEQKLSELGQEVLSLIDSKEDSKQTMDEDSKLVVGKISIDFSEEDKEKINEYVSLLNRHKTLTGKDDYATSEAMPVLQKLTSLLVATSHTDQESLEDSQKKVFGLMKRLIENNVKLPKLSSKINTSAEELRNSIFILLDPKYNEEDKLKERNKLTASLVRQVGVENLASNSSVNGKNVGLFAAVEKMFQLGGNESEMGSEWVGNLKDVLMPILVNPLDKENDGLLFDDQTLGYVHDIRKDLAKLSVESLNNNKELNKVATGRVDRNGNRITTDRKPITERIIESFEKSYTIGHDRDDQGQERDWTQEFHYQMATLAVDFAETRTKIAEAEQVLKQLNSSKRSKDEVTLIKGVPVKLLSEEQKARSLKDTLLQAFDEYKAKKDRLAQINDSKFRLTGYQLNDFLNSGEGVQGLYNNNGDTPVHIIKANGDKQQLRFQVYNDLMRSVKSMDSQVFDSSTERINAIIANVAPATSSTYDKAEEEDNMRAFLEATFEKAAQLEKNTLEKEISDLTKANPDNPGDNSVFTKSLSALTPSEGAATDSLADFDDRQALSDHIDNVLSGGDGANRINNGLSELGGKVLIKLNSATDTNLRKELIKSFDKQRKDATTQKKDDDKYRRKLANAMVTAVHEKGFVSIAAHQADSFLKLITNGDIEDGVLADEKIIDVFDHKSFLEPDGADRKLHNHITDIYNRNARMTSSMAMMVDAEYNQSLSAFLAKTDSRGTFDALKKDAGLIGSQVSEGDTDLREVISKVITRVNNLKTADASFGFTVDGDTKAALLKAYKDSSPISETKARLALRKVLTGTMNALKDYRGTSTSISTARSSMLSSNPDIISGKRLSGFEKKAGQITSRFEGLRQELDLAEATSWKDANTITDMVERDKESDGSDHTKFGINIMTDVMKAIGSIFLGSKSGDVQQYNSHITDVVKNEDSQGNPLTEILEEILQHRMAAVV